MTKDQVYGKKLKVSEVGVSSGTKFVGAVFVYVFLALVITFVVSTLMGALYNLAIFKDSEVSAKAFIYLFIISLIAYIPVLIWTQHAARNNSQSMTKAYICYSVLMGVLLSTFTLLVPFYIIALAFGLTCGSFGLMALIAWNSKKNLSNLGLVASGLFFGAIMMILFNFILGIFTSARIASLSASISFVVLIAVVLISVYDLNNVKRIAMSGSGDKNVALMCALNLYVDFIYIFII